MDGESRISGVEPSRAERPEGIAQPQELLCKGSWALGTACGRCARCAEGASAEIKSLKADLEMYARAWKRELGRYIAPKSHLIDALVVGTRRLVEDAERCRLNNAAIERWRHDASVARSLGVSEPSLLDYLPPPPAQTISENTRER